MKRAEGRSPEPGFMLVRRILSPLLLFPLILLLMYFPGARASSNDEPVGPVETGTALESSAGDGVHRLGCLPSSTGDYPRIELPEAMECEALSPSVDLSAQLPPVGDQGNQGSCVGWATSYYYKTWSEQQEHSAWSLSNTKYQFSPSFVYNQINGGSDSGAYFQDAFALLETKGDVDLAEMPYNQNDYRTQPTSAQLQAAKPYRIPAKTSSGWGYFWNTVNLGPYANPNPIDDVKAWLAAGNMVVMGIMVYYDFPDFAGNPAKPYYDYNGTSDWAGGHAVCIVGYDDNINPGGADADHRGGFKVVNSWGAGWNGDSNGFVYISYHLAKRYVRSAWSMNDLSPDAPAISSLSSSSGRVGDTIHIYGDDFGTLRRSARVSFNGANATNVTFTNEDITVKVPSGATSGPLVVYDWDGAPSNSAQFTLWAHTVSASVSGGGGSVSPSTQPVESGGTATIYLDPDPSYVIAGIKDNGCDKAITNPYVIQDVACDHGVVATFSYAPVHTITASTGANGTISPSGAVSVSDGADQSFTITPDPHYHVANLSIDGRRMGPSETYTFTNVTSDHSIAANFATIEHTVTASAGGNGAISPSGTMSVSDGDGLSFTITPDPGYTIKSIIDNGEAKRQANPYVVSDVDCDHFIEVAFCPYQNFYFAEGCTGPGFQEYLCLGNSNDFPVEVGVVYGTGSGLPPDEDALPYTIPALSRLTIDVNGVTGPGDVSIKVISPFTGVVAERPMYFDYGEGWTGGHDTVGATEPGRTWYFAEGYTGAGFDEYICVLNPGDVPAGLTFRFQTQEEGEIVRTGQSVPAGGRVTFKVNDLLGPDYQSSLKLEASVPIVAERTMYFNYRPGSLDWTGGHCVMGATSLSGEYYFAEGTTRADFEEWLTLQNPNSFPIIVDAIYQLGAGQGEPVSRSYTVGPGQRTTIFVAAEVGEGKDVSVKLVSTSDFLAERPMYFNYSSEWSGGHCVIGATATGPDWFFAEGFTGDGFSQYLCLQNAGASEATVEVSYFTQEEGPLQIRTVTIPAGTRATIPVDEDAGEDYQLSTLVRVTSGSGIVVERPMYFNYGGTWTGGHDVMGYRP
jgi:hypothetical protein